MAIFPYKSICDHVTKIIECHNMEAFELKSYPNTRFDVSKPTIKERKHKSLILKAKKKMTKIISFDGSAK